MTPESDEERTNVKPNMHQIMKQAQKMQAEMARVQEELKDETVEASAGGGMVKVVMTGDLSCRSVTIDPAAVDPEDVDDAPGHGRGRGQRGVRDRRRSSRTDDGCGHRRHGHAGLM